MDDIFPISTELFLSYIEETPTVWDKTLKTYKHKAVTRNAWKEILMKIYPDFETWDKNKRIVQTKKIIKKWTYIRDTYYKSLKKIELHRMYGRPVPKRYMFHKHLLFLANVAPSRPILTKPTQVIQSHQVECTIIKTEVEEPYDHSDEDESSGEADDLNSNNNSLNAEHITLREDPIKLTNKNQMTAMPSPVDGKMTQAGKINRHISFFNSLIPTVDKFDDDQVIEFQLGILQLMKTVKNTKPPNKQHATKD